MSVQATDGGVELRVHDDGPGLPPDRAEAAFARFVSLDNRGGSGLGLAIGRELARTHGGDLTYDDGAFVLRLPAVFDPPEEDGTHPGAPARAAASVTRQIGEAATVRGGTGLHGFGRHPEEP